MQPEDSQIDVLLKRYGREARSGAAAEHLDADELNAFAERSLPAAARSRYVSHLAAWDDCRGLATPLSIAAGATASLGAGAIETASGSPWQKLTSFFAPPVLRYAAFAAVLVMAVGVTFLALRNQRNSAPRVAQSDQANAPHATAVKQGDQPAPAATQTTQTSAIPSATTSQTAENPNRDLKKDESKVAANTTEPPKPQKDAIASTDRPAPLQKKAGELITAERREAQQPSFAPPPPGEAGRAQNKSLEERDAQRSASVSGPRKSEPADKFRVMDRSVGGISQNRAGEGADNRARNDQAMNQQSAVQQNQQSQNRGQDSTAEAPRMGNLSANRGHDEKSKEIAKKPATAAAPSESEKAPETRSAGGHKFRRQGNAWVDRKFKSSMSVTNVARGSDAFRALDPAVHAIAHQLGGEVIVVAKGKAYRIH